MFRADDGIINGRGPGSAHALTLNKAGITPTSGPDFA